ncbi:MAG: hypothetical protein A3F11_00275 [Gammaproteobacteria bacterium RIFCSPHIGHO2_12_FULL_37_14]|nr:MAG: hypothetical protein A3F11_00275 [Gammaproteobacteria bacterium RIFCSPHIGHO2_12_FULL_37_14]
MKNLFCTMFLLLLILPIKIFAISQQSLKKYPYPLLTNDYGILNIANLKRYVDGMIPEQFKWHITGLDYWQCFPSKNVTVWYDKGTYDPYDKVIRSDPHISIKTSPMVMHEYEPRRNFSIDYAKEKVAAWKRLMKNQQYVCVGGAFAGTRTKIVNGKEITEHGWIFENLKTKKGCDSYFSGWCK